MSAEVIAVVIAAAGLLGTLGGSIFAGFAWMIKRQDQRFDRVDQRFERIDGQFRELQHAMTEVKISVARLEGPRPQLTIPR